MARTKQTARKSTGGKAPRKQLYAINNCDFVPRTKAPKTIAKRVKKKNLWRRELCVLRQYAEHIDPIVLYKARCIVDVIRDDLFKKILAKASRLACRKQRARITFREMQMALTKAANHHFPYILDI